MHNFGRRFSWGCRNARPDPVARCVAREYALGKTRFALKIKQMAFDIQRMTQGMISKSPLQFLKKGADGIERIIKMDRVPDPANPTAPPVEVTRIVTPEQVAKENAGSLMIDPADGVTVLNNPRSAGACFVAGTLVHTDKGLVLIEKLRVGDRVLSQPEMKGEQAYKRVVNTFSFEDKTVYLISYLSGENICRLVATGNHPFWVKDKGWIQASGLDMSQGYELEFADGTHGFALSSVPLFQTTRKDVGWFFGLWGGGDEDNYEVDIRDGRVVIGEREVVSFASPQALLTTQVFNIEVEDFHTYYVGEQGIWVHNTNCGGEGVKPENPTIDLRPGSQTKLYDVLDSYKLDGPGVVLVKEKIRSNSAADIFERDTDFALTTADGWATPWTLLLKNSKGENAIQMGDGLQRMPDGSPSMTTIDAKSGPNGLGPLYDPTIPLNVREMIQAKALDSFRRASEALEQNPGRSHIVEFETKSAFDIAARFFSEVVAKKGYADNIMLRLRGMDYLTAGVVARGKEPVLIFDRSGNATSVENPVFTKASDGLNPTLDVANEFTKNYEAQCFGHGTDVVMSDGTRIEIQNLEPGCTVLARCEETGELAACRVLNLFEHEKVELYHLVYKKYDDGRKDGVYTTAQHPFWVKGKGWTPVCDLEPGQLLETHTGEVATIIEVKKTGHSTTVYNLEVEGFHTYFVGTYGVLVHNKNTTDAKIQNELSQLTPNAAIVDNGLIPDLTKPITDTYTLKDQRSAKGEIHALKSIAETGRRTEFLPNTDNNLLGRDVSSHPDGTVDYQVADVFTPIDSVKPGSVATTVEYKGSYRGQRRNSFA